MQALYHFSRWMVVVLVSGTVFFGNGDLRAQGIDLGDVLAGGDGTGTGTFSGVDPDTGEFVPVGGLTPDLVFDNDGVNPSPVAASEFIDSVFLMPTENMAINTEGTQFQFGAGDILDFTFGQIIANNTHLLPDVGEEGIFAGGRDDWSSAVSCHASAGVTFDLDALREEHSADAVGKFGTFAGHANCGEESDGITHYIIFSNDAEIVGDPEIIEVPLTDDAGTTFFEDIPAEATYLTLATGMLDGEPLEGWYCDMGVFANPFIYPTDFTAGECAELSVSPAALQLAPGEMQGLQVSCLDANLLPTDVTEEAAMGTTYEASPDGVVTVSADGLVTGDAPGEAEITVTNAGGQATVAVTVGDPEACAEDSSLEVVPREVLVRPQGTFQLAVTCENAFGDAVDFAPADKGTTYAADPEAVATVDENGLIRGVSQGEATVTVTNGAFSQTVAVLVLSFLDLGDMAAGGDGTGSGGGDQGEREFTAINIDTGALLTEEEVLNSCADTFDDDLVNPSPVDDSEFVDSVFFMTADVMPINSEGVEVEFQEFDAAGNSFNHILSNFSHFVCDGVREIITGNRNDWQSAVGINAAAGITYDLEAIREEYGEENVRKLSCFVGRFTAGVTPVKSNHYVIYSNETEIVPGPRTTDGAPYFFTNLGGQNGEIYSEDIPAEAIFLTLAVGSAGDGIGEDAGVFANARIVPDVALACQSISVTPEEVSVVPDGSAQLAVECVDQFGIPQDVSAADSGTTYSVEPEGIVTVDENGLIQAVADSGNAEITVQNGQESVTVPVSVKAFLELSDMVAGGDGLGTGGGDNGNREFTGINIDTGEFITIADAETAHEQRFEENGINPSPVEASEFIDAVFFMEQEVLALDSAMSVEVEWPAGDVAANSWNHILSNFTHLLENNDRGLSIAGTRDWETNVAVHAAAGITFDLEAIRDEYGPEAVGTLSLFAGSSNNLDCGNWMMTLYIIYSTEDEVLPDPTLPEGSDPPYYVQPTRGEDFQGPDTGGFGEAYEGPIPQEAVYLTLATGAGGDDWPCDHGNFANARILPATVGGGFKRGDSNANGTLDIGDPILNLGHQFLGDQVVCRDALDYNDSGTIDLTDPIANLGHQFLGSAPPEAPGKEQCGPDPSDDDGIDCEAYPQENC